MSFSIILNTSVCRALEIRNYPGQRQGGVLSFRVPQRLVLEVDRLQVLCMLNVKFSQKDVVNISKIDALALILPLVRMCDPHTSEKAPASSAAPATWKERFLGWGIFRLLAYNQPLQQATAPPAVNQVFLKMMSHVRSELTALVATIALDEEDVWDLNQDEKDANDRDQGSSVACESLPVRLAWVSKSPFLEDNDA